MDSLGSDTLHNVTLETLDLNGRLDPTIFPQVHKGEGNRQLSYLNKMG